MAEKPNLVVIYCDDLGYGDLGCYGSDGIKTPHVDALAEDGVRFTDWYSNSPVCSPSRAALLTGRYPNRAGVPRILAGKRGTPGLPGSERTLATHLRPRLSNGVIREVAPWRRGRESSERARVRRILRISGWLCRLLLAHLLLAAGARRQSGSRSLAQRL
jgi:hypothetical protein